MTSLTTQSADFELASLRSQLAAVTGALGPAQRGLSLEAAVRRLVTEVTQVRAWCVLQPAPHTQRFAADSSARWSFQGVDSGAICHSYAVVNCVPSTLPSITLRCSVSCSFDTTECYHQWSQAAKGRVAAEEQLVVLREQGNALEQALAAQTQQTEREEIRACTQFTEVCSSTWLPG